MDDGPFSQLFRAVDDARHRATVVRKNKLNFFILQNGDFLVFLASVKRGAIKGTRYGSRINTAFLPGKGFLKYPDEKTAVLELEPPKDPENPNVSFWMSGEDNLKEVMTADNPAPYIAFTKKLSDKIYEGAFFGYLYGYTEAPSSSGGLFQDYVIKFKEQLLSITITLP